MALEIGRRGLTNRVYQVKKQVLLFSFLAAFTGA
jgi:hypothetical protein